MLANFTDAQMAKTVKVEKYSGFFLHNPFIQALEKYSHLEYSRNRSSKMYAG